MPALTAQDVRTARFLPTRFRAGYAPSEVDALLGRVATSLDDLTAGHAGPGTLTGDDVLHATFGETRFRPGYDQDEVDDFLDLAVEALRAAHAAARGTTGGAAGG